MNEDYLKKIEKFSRSLDKWSGKHEDSFKVDLKKILKIALLLFVITAVYIVINSELYKDDGVLYHLFLAGAVILGILLFAIPYSKVCTKLILHVKNRNKK